MSFTSESSKDHRMEAIEKDPCGEMVELRSLAELYQRAFEDHAERPAARDAGCECTYAELGGSVRRLISALRRLGIEPQSRALMVAPNSVQWMLVERALAMGGYARVPLLPRLHPSELAQISLDAEPAIVFVDGDWLAANGREWIPAQVRHTIVLGRDPGVEGIIALDALLASGEDAPLPSLPGGDDVAAILYTSGSTGTPKGVRLTQHNLGARARGVLAEFADLAEADVALHTAPISHFSGGICDAITVAGGLNVLEEGFDAAHVADVAASGEITVLPLVPTMITMLLEEVERRGEPAGGIGRVRFLPYAGSAIRPDRAEKSRRHFGEVMYQFYGASEAQMPIVALHPHDHVPVTNERGLPRTAAAGRQTRYVDVQIVDEDRRPVAPGESGEIATRGAHVVPGYWRNEQATAEVFADGWCFTGDVGYFDESGYLFLLDRSKDVVITGGFNVYPREIENVISAMEGVREVVVLGAPDERWGEAITAIVSVADGSGIESETVIAHCRGHLGGYKVPKRVLIVDDLPKGGTGKIDRVTLRERLWRDEERRV